MIQFNGLISVDGSWSEWGVWGTCNRYTGKKERKRTCTNPKPFKGGKPCPGSDKEEDMCQGKIIYQF